MQEFAHSAVFQEMPWGLRSRAVVHVEFGGVQLGNGVNLSPLFRDAVIDLKTFVIICLLQRHFWRGHKAWVSCHVRCHVVQGAVGHLQKPWKKSWQAVEFEFQMDG